MGVFSILEEFLDIFGGKKEVLWPFGGILGLLDAFWWDFQVFEGNMVGKWTNEPCNGVDEVVNHFWVLTDSMDRILMRIPCAEMWLRPAGEGEMYYQLNVFFPLPVACVSFVMCLIGFYG